MIIGLLISAVIVAALADALNDSGRKNWGHPVEALEKVLLMGLGVLFVYGSLCRELVFINLGLGILAYTFVRIALFDYAYNIFRGLPLDYHGTSCWWDRFLGKFPEGGILFSKIILFLVGISIIIKYL
jgi:hypothetical protein